MPTPHLGKILKELSFAKKLIVAGSLLMVLSLFLPWYQDSDIFQSQIVFTGLNGPLYLIGFTFLILSSFSLVLLVMDYLGLKISSLAFKYSKIHLATGLISFYLLILVNSIYFDRNFGINLLTKESRFGMFIAFIAAAFFTVGGYLAGRERSEILKQFQQQVEGSTIKMPVSEQQKPRESLRPNSRTETKFSSPHSQQTAMDMISGTTANVSQQIHSVSPKNPL